MLEVALQPLQGSAAQASFPTDGRYGQTPVIIEGRVRLRTLDAGASTVPITKIVVRVRCYEQCSPGTSWPKRILWEKAVVVKESNPETSTSCRWDKWSRSFRLSVPLEARRVAPGTIKTKEYQVTWRAEAIVYHSPMAGAGDRITRSYSLSMRDHSTRVPSDASTSSDATSHRPTRSLAPDISCMVETNVASLQLGAALEATLALSLPADLRSARAQFSIRRTCAFRAAGRGFVDGTDIKRELSPANSLSSLTSTQSEKNAAQLEPGTSAAQAQSVTTTICQGDWIDVGSRGSSQRSLQSSLVVPAEQHGGWDVGRTMHEQSIDMTFNIHVRLRLVDGLFSRSTEHEIVGPSIQILPYRSDVEAQITSKNSVNSTAASPAPKSTGKRKARPLETTVALYGLGRNTNIGLPPPPKATKIRWGDREPLTRILSRDRLAAAFAVGASLDSQCIGGAETTGILVIV